MHCPYGIVDEFLTQRYGYLIGNEDASQVSQDKEIRFTENHEDEDNVQKTQPNNVSKEKESSSPEFQKN